MDDQALPFEPTQAPAPAPGQVSGQVSGQASQPRVDVRRSARRRRTVSARMEGDVMVLMIPAGASAAQERRWTEEMLAKLQRRGQGRGQGTPVGDADLDRRARDLARRLDLPEPVSVRWVTNQEHRWGSCTPAHGTIRISHRLQHVPAYVVDAVLVHELAHLAEPGHGPRFRALADRYPRSERATGYLEALATAAGWPEGGEDEC